MPCVLCAVKRRPSFGTILKDLVALRAADTSPTPALNVVPHVRGLLNHSSSTPSNEALQGRLTAAAAAGGAAGVASSSGMGVNAQGPPLIIIGSMPHVST